jgi:hypothetical protein
MSVDGCKAWADLYEDDAVWPLIDELLATRNRP